MSGDNVATLPGLHALPGVDFIDGAVVFFYGLIFFGIAKLLAQRYEGHPAADAYMSLYGS